jgi:serine/threonine protein kinase
MLSIDLKLLLKDETFHNVEIPYRDKSGYGGYILHLLSYTNIFDNLPKPSEGKHIINDLYTTNDKISSGACSYCFVCKDSQGKKYLFKGSLLDHYRADNEFKIHNRVYESSDGIDELESTCKPLYEIVMIYGEHRINGYVMEYLEGYQEFDDFINLLNACEKKKYARVILSKVLMYLCSISKKIPEFCHSDIKSSNILVKKNKDGDLSVKIIDFGCSSDNQTRRRLEDNVSNRDYIAINELFSRF